MRICHSGSFQQNILSHSGRVKYQWMNLRMQLHVYRETEQVKVHVYTCNVDDSE